jgi:translation initiation factor IF-1
MPREVPVRARLIIEAALSDRHYRARLPNGKEVIAHLERRAPAALRSLAPGTAVTGELSPYDFDHARIAGLADPMEKQENL